MSLFATVHVGRVTDAHFDGVAVTSAESVERLRSWASGRCLSADKPGIYKFTSGSGKARRKIPRDPSVN